MIFNITGYILQSQLNQMIKSFMKIGRSGFLKFPKSKTEKSQKPEKPTSRPQKFMKANIPQTRKQKIQIDPVVSWLQKNPTDMIIDSSAVTIIKKLIAEAKFQLIAQAISKANKQQIKKIFTEVGELCEIIIGEQLLGNFTERTPYKLQTITNIIKNSQQTTQKHHHWISELMNSYLKHRQEIKHQQQIEKQIHNILCITSKHFSEHFKSNKTYFNYIADIYFERDEKLGQFLQLVSVCHTDHFTSYIQQLQQQFMMHRITKKKSAFTITDLLIQHYKRAYEQQDYHLAIGCTLVAVDADFSQLLLHFKQYMSIGLSKMPLDIGRKVVEKALLNLSDSNEQNLNAIMKTSKDPIAKILAAVKIGHHEQAFALFQETILKPRAIQRMRLNLLFIMKKYNLEFTDITQKQYGIAHPEEVVSNLPPQYLWELHKKKNQFLIEFKDKLGEDIHSYWKETFQKLRKKEIYQWQALGLLEQAGQVYPVDQNEFDLQKYLTEQYPTKKVEYQQEYQKEKEFIKFCLKVQYAIEEYITEPDQSIQKILFDAQQALHFEENKQIFQNAGLLNYKIDQYGWQPFVQRYRHFHRNNFVVKDPQIYQFFNQGKARIEGLSQKKAQEITKEVIDQITLKYREFWDEAQKVIKLNSLDPSVIQLIRWGLYMKEPIAIYMGEKLAMTSSRYIPHQIAQQVSNMLSYRRQIDQNLLHKCKQALRIVGKITRIHIYDPNKDYHHILRRNELCEVSQKWAKQQQLNEKRFEDFQLWTANWKEIQQQQSFYLKSAKKGQL